ncbi:hypothetical protein FPOAC2_14282 [Fusarium poae]|uniref:Uncharacterized protein n=1 Tax=Fusarium poae TaxID=36050 RepID=A0A1B8A5U5_FUSPO|nr:hypothetical protein FPOA_13778 [Fusarium poae]OBS15384.1 hypothetical protein FPOA_13773 [Fusarium poae]OBS15837.1 hypothetical protein FPOA_13398 [Fusarium poae]OBS16558.1 hypothetical protein FPOA_12819 [Fusarium poae]
MSASRAPLDPMARGEYMKLDEKRALQRSVLDRDREHGTGKEAKPWERLKRLAKTPYKRTNRYLQVPDSRPAQSVVHSAASHPLDTPSRVAEDRTRSTTEDHRKEDGRIFIHFTHNHPCREDGEDEDLRCLWIDSSDDEADGQVIRT